jgi:pilus assembly protein Flp/PilA
MRAPLARWLRCERGVTAIEYALIAGLISAALIASVGSLGDTIQTTFDHVRDAVTGAEQAGKPGGGPPPGKGNGNGNNGNGKGNGGSGG